MPNLGGHGAPVMGRFARRCRPPVGKRTARAVNFPDRGVFLAGRHPRVVTNSAVVEGFALPVLALVASAAGLAIAWLSYRLHVARKESRDAAAAATARAERLDAILNMTADGIIVIDAKGTIEAFNPGAQDAVRLPGIGGHRPQRQHADAVAPSRGARQLPGALLDDRRRAGSSASAAKSPAGGATARVFPVHLSVGEMRIGGERKFTGMLHDLTQARAPRRRARRQRSAVARGDRFGRGRHHRHRRAWPGRSVQPGGRAAVRLRGRRGARAGTSTC